jgi:hypothetical protein
MEPASYLLAIVRPVGPDVWTRLRAELDDQGDPAIAFERRTGTVRFQAATGDFMLRSRVAAALETVCGHGEWLRAFRELD